VLDEGRAALAAGKPQEAAGCSAAWRPSSDLAARAGVLYYVSVVLEGLGDVDGAVLAYRDGRAPDKRRVTPTCASPAAGRAQGLARPTRR
jgi:hypothetical protein